MSAYDPGPPPAIAEIFSRVPGPPDAQAFWGDWGPIFYRGRLDGSARILCIASDPGATERIAMRTLVGNAGQRVQGFLAKLGLTTSYLCVNAFGYALMPSHAGHAKSYLEVEEQRAWRNELYDAVASPQLQAIIAFGANARDAFDLWDTRPDLPVERIPHPTSHDEHALVTAWHGAIERLRAIVTPETAPAEPNYGDAFQEHDYVAIPRADLPFGVPAFLGDDGWARTRQPPLNSTVSRPRPDDRHTLIWVAKPADPPTA